MLSHESLYWILCWKNIAFLQEQQREGKWKVTNWQLSLKFIVIDFILHLELEFRRSNPCASKKPSKKNCGMFFTKLWGIGNLFVFSTSIIKKQHLSEEFYVWIKVFLHFSVRVKYKIAFWYIVSNENSNNFNTSPGYNSLKTHQLWLLTCIKYYIDCMSIQMRAYRWIAHEHWAVTAHNWSHTTANHRTKPQSILMWMLIATRSDIRILHRERPNVPEKGMRTDEYECTGIKRQSQAHITQCQYSSMSRT